MDLLNRDIIKGLLLVSFLSALFAVMMLASGCDISVENDEASSDHAIGYYLDEDGDGYGVSTANALKAFSKPVGYVRKSNDCDDTDALINPGATDDTVDGTDQNCDGTDGT